MTSAEPVVGPELLLDLHGSHRSVDVEAALRNAVLDGRLVPGSRLPSSRTLAVELGLARGTVTTAYAQLVAEGWLAAVRGSGTRVAQGPWRVGRAPEPPPTPPAEALVDLRPGVPDVGTFPRAAWSRAAERSLRQAPRDVLDYPDPRGHLGLRTELLAYLARARGVRTSAANIVVCSGFVQVLDLLARVLLDQGRTTIGVESCSLPLHREALAAAGLTVRAVPVDAEGARVDSGGGTAGWADLDAALLTPAHQYPLGVALAPARRAAALAWAGERDGLVVEDDYDGELRYDRAPIGALQGLAPDLVAYVGTASKALAPAVGLAWVALPPRLVGPVVAVKERCDGVGVLEQLALADLLASGGYERHVRSARAIYRRRRDHLVAVLRRRCPAVEVQGLAAGLHVVLTVPGHRAKDEPALVEQARGAGLVLSGLGPYRVVPDPAAPAALVVGYARPAAHEWRAALDDLAGFLSEVARA